MSLQSYIAKQNLLHLLVIGTVLAAGAYVFLRGTRGAARDIASTVGGAAVDAVAGAVEGIGESIGIPVTSQSACEAAIARGDRWDASFACPAGTFVRWLWTGNGPVAPDNKEQ